MYPLTRATEIFRQAVKIAHSTAAELGTSFVGSEHFIYAFLSFPECEAYKILAHEGLTKEEYGALFTKTVDTNYRVDGWTESTQRLFNKAVDQAEADGLSASTAHMLYQILHANCQAVKYLKRFVDIQALIDNTSLTLRILKNKKEWGEVPQETTYTDPLSGAYSASESLQPSAKEAVLTEEEPIDITKAKKSYRRESEKLSAYGIELTARAAKGKMDPVIGRKKEIEKVVQVLSRRLKNNPVLVGEPGVGKSAIVEGLSQLIITNQVPEQLYNKKVLSVDLPGMLAGTRYRGDFEEKLKNLLDTVMEDGDIVLFIDEIHTLVGAGGSADGSMDAANILKPLLARGDLQVIGATTIEEYRKYIEKDSALERRFTPVYVDEPSEKDTIEIIRGLRGKYEEHHGIIITDEAIETAVKLSSRYITDRFLPDKAIDLVDEAAARVRIVEDGGSSELREVEKEIAVLTEEEEMHLRYGKHALATEARKARMYAEDKKRALEQAQKPKKLSDGKLAIGKEHIAAIVSARVKIPLLKMGVLNIRKAPPFPLHRGQCITKHRVIMGWRSFFA